MSDDFVVTADDLSAEIMRLEAVDAPVWRINVLRRLLNNLPIRGSASTCCDTPAFVIGPPYVYECSTCGKTCTFAFRGSVDPRIEETA